MSEQPQIGDRIVQSINQFAETAGRAIIEWVERNRPALEALAEFVSDPEVRAILERARTASRYQTQRPCHCLCVTTHPDDAGICDGDGVTARHFDTPSIGPVDVPLCAPCAVAQGLRDLAA